MTTLIIVNLVGKKQETLRITLLEKNMHVAVQAHDPLASYFFRPGIILLYIFLKVRYFQKARQTIFLANFFLIW